jgi:AcrR family transcriptional regulator
VEEHLRSDARHNRDRLIEVAADAFARDGSSASLKAIAADAGVGIGTLYRHFPTRDALYIAVHRRDIALIAERADELLTSEVPLEALRDWLKEFADFLAAKQGMAETFRAVMAGGQNPFLDLRELTNAAAKRLIVAAAGDGVRQDVEPIDVLTAVHGVTLATSDAAQVERLVALLLAGLRS